MAKTPKTEPRSLTAFLRRLRPMLPGEVEKIDETTYRVNNRAIVSLNYYCSVWRSKEREDAKKKQKRECYPTSVAIKFSNNEIEKQLGNSHKPTTSLVFNSRSIQKNKAGDINLESVATAITKCCNAVDRWIAGQKTYKADQAKRAKEIKEAGDQLLKNLPANLGFRYNGGLRNEMVFTSDKIQTTITLSPYAEVLDNYLDLNLYGCTIEIGERFNKNKKINFDKIKKILAVL